jgi:hypothetical protein
MMTRPRLEVAEIFRSFQDEYFQTHSVSNEQQRVFQSIVACRTAVLGGHVTRCDQCGHEEISYNSCRNRHCPKCQAKKQADWCEERSRDLLDVPYFHIVFTLPDELGSLALQNKQILYNLLFRAAAETLLTIARDEKHLGAHIGFLAVLHTWGQTLVHHPHLHCVVPAGGISPDQSRWIFSRKNFFLPVRVLSRLFQKKFLANLDQLYRQNQLRLEGQLEHLVQPRNWHHFLQNLQKIDWVVYAKAPFGSPRQVLKYLARYTHRVAISNRRLLSFQNKQVTFSYKDYRQKNAHQTMSLSALEFIRRFLIHVLPKRFVRIRHYGFLANRSRNEKLALCRRLLKSSPSEPPTSLPSVSTENPQGNLSCPACKKGQMIRIKTHLPTVGWIEPRMNSPGPT